MKSHCDRTQLPGQPMDYAAIREQIDNDLFCCGRCRNQGVPLRIIMTTDGIALVCADCFGFLQ